MRNAFVMVCFSSLLINYIPAKDSYENAYPGATWAPPSNLFFYVSVLSLFVFDLFHFYRIFPSRILDNRRTTHIEHIADGRTQIKIACLLVCYLLFTCQWRRISVPPSATFYALRAVDYFQQSMTGRKLRKIIHNQDL